MTIKNTSYSIIGIILLGIFFFCMSCSKDDNTTTGNNGNNNLAALDNIDTSSSANEVVSVPSNLPAPLPTLFANYTKVVAPNGKPIHIFATSGVSIAQVVRSRNLLEYILRDAPGTEFGSDKSAIANQLADNRATLLYFDTEEQSFANRDQVSALGLSVQDLYASESPVEGTQAYLNNTIRDAGYEEIFHMVHGHGIQAALPTFDSEIRAADQAAHTAGIYSYTGDASPFEYIISAFDVYFGLWAHSTSGSSFDGEYTPTTRANLLTIDPTGYGLVEKFFLPYLDWNVQLDESFMGTFSLSLDSTLPYTLKSRYMKDVTLTGTNNSNLRVNQLDNNITGNSGTNTVIFSGVSSEYTINTSNGITIVTDNTSDRDGVNTLTNIEKVQFTDQTIEL